MVANNMSGSGSSSYHARLKATGAKVLANAIVEDLHRGSTDEMRGHMIEAVQTLETHQTLESRARADLYLAIAQGARALGEMDRSEGLVRRIVTMQGGNMLGVIAAAERLQSLLMLDRGDMESARRLAQTIDKLHVIRPHAQTLLDGHDENVSIGTYLVIAEIELADRQIECALVAMERARARVEVERSDDITFTRDYHALMLMNELVLGCAGDADARARLYDLPAQWAGNHSVSAILRARLALLLDAVSYDLVNSDEGSVPDVLNVSETSRWRGFHSLLHNQERVSRPPQSHAEPFAEVHAEPFVEPIVTPSTQPLAQVVPAPPSHDARVRLLDDEPSVLDIDELFATHLPAVLTPQAVATGDVGDANSSPLGDCIADAEAHVPPMPAAATPLGEFVVRLDVMAFDIVIQGLERAAATGRLDLLFDEGTVSREAEQGAQIAGIPDAQAVTGGSLYLTEGLLIDASLQYQDGGPRGVDPFAALAMLAQISIGAAASVQASFVRSNEVYENRFGAGNNTALLLSILTGADTADQIEAEFEVTAAEVTRGDSATATPNVRLAEADRFAGGNGSLSPIEVFTILNAATTKEVCEALSRALAANCVELLYRGEPIAAAGIHQADQREIVTHYGEFSLRICTPNDAPAIAFDDREQALIELAYNRLFAMPRVERASDIDRPNATLPDNIVAASAAMFELFGIVHRLAQFDGTGLPLAHILILGETGVGKEIVASMIHTCSGRANKPFLPVNSAAILDDLATATVFGAKKGSYTGADSDRPGLIESAEGGTLFLDEIGSTSTKLQAMLLRVTQDGSYQRLGDPNKKTANVRFVMATNKNIEDADEFKNDLKHRCQVITVPPLRARREDIRPLADHFARLNTVTLSEAAYMWLERQDWPGNVRELGQFIQRAAAQSGVGSVVNPATLDAVTQQSSAFPPPLPPLLAGETYSDALHRIEREFLLRVLQQESRNMNQAARLFGVVRNTFLNRLKAHDLQPEKSE